MTPEFVFVEVAGNQGPLVGVIIGQEWDEEIGQSVWVVRFTRKYTARLTEREIQRVAIETW
jgi:hypothetical protein